MLVSEIPFYLSPLKEQTVGFRVEPLSIRDHLHVASLGRCGTSILGVRVLGVRVPKIENAARRAAAAPLSEEGQASSEQNTVLEQEYVTR